jgi:hypothetical protein
MKDPLDIDDIEEIEMIDDLTVQKHDNHQHFKASVMD